MTLNEVKSGTSVKIEGIEASELKTRLMSLGLVKGTTIKVLKSAPLGDPISIDVRSYHLALRLQDAAKISVSTIA